MRRTRWDEVRAWLDDLRDLELPALSLSPPGAALVWNDALDALHPVSLDAVSALEGTAFPSARLVVAGTVFTAPLEWCAVLLGRGTELTVKLPRGASDVASVAERWARAAQRHGLPLHTTRDRVPGAEPLTIAMGTDATMREVEQSLQNRPQGTGRFLAFGHRYSASYFPTGADAHALARDLAAHDSRGCMSPAVVFTDHPDAIDVLAEALVEAEQRWPRGVVSDAEHAAIRHRRSLARITGEARVGEGWELHALPASHWRPLALPRCLAVVPVSDPAEARARLQPHRASLSTFGTPMPIGLAPPVREVPLGTMQTPPLRRLHDGIDWLAATLQDGPRDPTSVG